MAAALPAGPSHVHLVTAGTLDLRLHDGAVVRLEPCDLALLPHGQGHEIAFDTNGDADPIEAFLSAIYRAEARDDCSSLHIAFINRELRERVISNHPLYPPTGRTSGADRRQNFIAASSPKT